MKKRLISIDVTCIPYMSFVKELTELAKRRESSYVCVSNVHMLVEAYNHKTFAEVVNSADYVTPDGMPLAKSIQWLYKISQDRVAGMDLLPDLMKEACEHNVSVFFYGGTEEVLAETKTYCEQYYPNLHVSGLISPPFRALTSEEQQDYVNKINNSNAGFVFVVLGCPKQEKWMASMKGSINACMVGIGGALPVMIGMQKRAPQWMRNAGLEWLFRFVQEPKRLYKRYLITNSLFVVLLIKEFLKRGVIRR